MAKAIRYNFKRIFSNLLWALLGMGAVVLLGAAMSLRKNKHCKGVNINISGTQNNFFIDKKEIAGILENLCGGSMPGKALTTFNLAAIENTLKKNEWIKNAELFFDNNEILSVEVTEREPVARIFTNTGSSFYLDVELKKLPLSDKSSARVPVFSNFPGQINTRTKADSNLLRDIKNISSYILKDPFWMAQIDQVDINAGTFEMIPKVGNQIILFGNADNYEEKFNNLLTFYKQVATKVGWNKYSKINVQYKGQVVAVKRGMQDVLLDSMRTKQLMESLVLNAQKMANDSTKNIQLVQLPDDNAVPAAPRFDDASDEQTAADESQPVITMDTSRNTKTTITEKKISPPVDKNLKLKTTPDKLKDVKNTLSKPVSTNPKSSSTAKANSISQKKDIVLKSSATKTINKPIIKPVNKTEIKPKAIMPPKQ